MSADMQSDRAMLIAAELLARIVAHAAEDPDREACGLLFGDDARIATAERVRNISARPHDSFEIDPQPLFAALRAERRGGARLIGCYHSHPNGSATPSARDAAHAEPGRLWLIVAGPRARLWMATAAGFESRPLNAG